MTLFRLSTVTRNDDTTPISFMHKDDTMTNPYSMSRSLLMVMTLLLLVISQVSLATAISPRITETAYDSKGRFAISSSNALNHSESYITQSGHGELTSQTGPNGLTTTWTYDSFGRKVGEQRADGTTSTITRQWCDGFNGYAGYTECPSLGVLALITQADGGEQTVSISDALGRVIRTVSTSRDGTLIFSDVEYNARGEIARKSKPYFKGTPSQDIKWSTLHYDVLSRVYRETSPDGSENNTGYNGLETTIVNANGQINTRVKNVLGQVTLVHDADTNETRYQYDHFGNLTKTIDEDGNEIINSYDIRGRKTQMIDPDMGTWTYSYNALGELVSQTDAKGQTVTMQYDLLGRMVSRTEPEGTSTWQYDTALNGIGKLHVETSSQSIQVKTYSYDNLGRASNVTTQLAGSSYTTTTSYDSYSRVSQITYPSSTHYSQGLKVNYNYSTVSDGAQGYLKTVSNNATGNNYWQAKAQNAAGQLTEIELGNGLTTQYVYDANTDLINTIKTGTAQAPNSIQHLGFEFDSIGNLTTRTDYTQIVNGLATNWLSESFQYDLLNRMTQSHVNGQSAKTYQYDALGNITFKTGVGNYSYGNNAGPHAVTQTNLNGTLTNYTYDANGSMISGNGRAISYSSFNKPTNISTANSDISFQYGADRSRVSRTDNTTGKTRYYIGSLFEVETHSSLTTYTHFIKAAGSTVAIETSKSDNSHTLRYLHKDHLGSITHMTDEQGLVTETQSYDPHGKRRNADWSDITGNPSSSATTDRGFTGHEHIDEVNLIHMNGRVYDPTLGRFISADPFIQAPLNSQSLNRYSYVMNNPLSYTDPSGFFFKSIFKAVKKLVKGIAKAVKNVVSAIAGSPIGRIVVTAVVCQGNPACYAAISGAFTAANGGSIKDILKSAAVAYVQAQAFDLVGTEFPGPIENVIAHGVVGGAFSEIQGGNFFSGFVSGGFGAFASNELDLGFFGTMVAGGVGSVLGGGKFQNGAVTAAFGYVHNCLKHPNVCSGKIRHQEIETLDIHSPQPELVVDVGGGGISKFAATLKRFWDKSLKFQGNKVFQRNDLIDPGKIDPKTGLSNLDLMKAGRAPIGPDDKPINLHHMIQKHNGAIAEMTQTFHQKNSKIIHINPSSTPSGINRAEFNKWRARYWRERSKDF